MINVNFSYMFEIVYNFLTFLWGNVVHFSLLCDVILINLELGELFSSCGWSAAVFAPTKLLVDITENL